MGRKVLAVVCGLVSAWGLMIVGKMVATSAGYNTPNGFEFMSRSEVAAYFSSQPTELYAALLITSLIGGFFGGYVVTNMSRRESPGLTMTMIVAAFWIVVGLINFFVLLPGQPVWLIVSTLGSYIPVTMLGHKLA